MAKSKDKSSADAHYANLIKRKQYGHWKSSAEKTRFSAFALWDLSSKSSLIAELKAKCPNGTGDSCLTLSEAFRRESALALELVVKAVIARKIIDGVLTEDKLSLSHDIPILWKNADIGDLSKDDSLVLWRAKQILTWSGRYATPKRAASWKEEDQEFEKIQGRNLNSKDEFTFQLGDNLNWSDFDRLYQKAYKVLVSPHPA